MDVAMRFENPIFTIEKSYFFSSIDRVQQEIVDSSSMPSVIRCKGFQVSQKYV